MDGDVEAGTEALAEEDAKTGKAAQEARLDPETAHLLHTQRRYYDSVHVIKEKVGGPCCQWFGVWLSDAYSKGTRTCHPPLHCLQHVPRL